MPQSFSTRQFSNSNSTRHEIPVAAWAPAEKEMKELAEVAFNWSKSVVVDLGAEAFTTGTLPVSNFNRPPDIAVRRWFGASPVPVSELRTPAIVAAIGISKSIWNVRNRSPARDNNRRILYVMVLLSHEIHQASLWLLP